MIKPNKISLRSKNDSNFFYIARSMQLNDADSFGFKADSGDLHMIKNDEWGAAAYLSQSKYGKYGNNNYTGANKEIYQNKSSKYITGLSNGTPSQNDTLYQYKYNNLKFLGTGQGQAGPGASTTGNIYGIYDMSGGSWECVMGVLAYYEDNSPMSGMSLIDNSGFTGKVYQDGTYEDFINDPPIAFPERKYYVLYKIATTKEGMPAKSDLNNSIKACNGGTCYGQALSETSGWYGDYTEFAYRDHPWCARSGRNITTTGAGIFLSYFDVGNGNNLNSSRFVFAP